MPNNQRGNKKNARSGGRMKTESIKKYYGFAKKANATIIGTDKIVASNNVYLIFASDTLAENAQERLKRKSAKANCIFQLLSKQEFELVEPNQSIKAIGIKNKELAKAMQK